MTELHDTGRGEAGRWTGDQWLLFGLCLVSIEPYSLSIGGIGVSANYLFVFIPFMMAAVGSPRPLVIRWEVANALLFFGIIYLAGLRFDIAALEQGIEPAARRLASFVVFLLPFSLAFVQFRRGDLDVFKMAVVAEAVQYVLVSIGNAARLLPTTPIEQMKGLVGSQRFGFVLCLAFFIVLYADRLVFRRALHLQRLALTALLLAGIGLTFSRASLVALAAGILFGTIAAGLGVLARAPLARRRQRDRSRRRSGALIGLATVGVVLVGLLLAQPNTAARIWDFYVVRLIDPALDSSLLTLFAQADLATSEGYRAYMWLQVLDYLWTHPLMGSSFQGVYLMFEEFREAAHSAHGQYIDVVARTGLLGFAVWSALLARIVWFCRRDRGLLAGMISILVFGFFHETFKLSQGGFIFAMLLSFAYLPASAWQVPAAPVAGR